MHEPTHNEEMSNRNYVGICVSSYRRKFQISPAKGLVLETTVVIMFHPIFLTKIDKSFRIQCRYQEADKKVTQQLDVRFVNLLSCKIFHFKNKKQSFKISIPVD